MSFSMPPVSLDLMDGLYRISRFWQLQDYSATCIRHLGFVKFVRVAELCAKLRREGSVTTRHNDENTNVISSVIGDVLNGCRNVSVFHNLVTLSEDNVTRL